jgi:hypothetical protein
MAELPTATTAIDDDAGAQAGGTELLAVLACVPQNADLTPRVFASTKALLTKHGYAEGVDYCAHHFTEPRKQILFVGLPIVTAGVIGRYDASGNSGSSVISVAAGAGGVVDKGDFEVEVVKGGTIGTDQILLTISADGGRTKKSARLGTASSYTIPYFGLVLSFAAGTLVTGDLAYKFSTTAPRWDQAGLTAAREALVAQQKQVRSFLVVGDLVVKDDATHVLDEINAYETENQRFVFARAQVRDRLPASSMSKILARMTGSPNLTFAEVGGTGDTITRSAGSWVTDGFAAGDFITVTGSVSNNVSGKITGVTATVLTLDTTDLAAEGPVGGCAVTAAPCLTFAEVGGTGDTITRNRGSWLDDGFAVGDVVTVTGSVSNNVTGPIAALTATVLTFGTTDLAAEVASSYVVSITGGEDDSTWVAAIDATFADIDDERRIDLGAGRGRKTSRITGYNMRRPVQWAASLREYQHDVQVPVWRKSDGKCKGWDLKDEEGNTVEHDERTDGGLLLARFTCFRSWANGPAGAFIALSLTRALEGSMLSRTHNMAVANVGSSVCQAETEHAIGFIAELNSDGTAQEASLRVLEGKVNSALAIALLQDKPEGRRASNAVWTASRTDDLRISPSNPTPTLHGTLELDLNGTIERIETLVKINSAA